ncbi:MAG: ATP-binding protein [Saprospiraceae bacterium]
MKNKNHQNKWLLKIALSKVYLRLHWCMAFTFILITCPSLFSQKSLIQDSIPTQLNSDNYKVIHHGVENGLSQGTAYSILKDSRGFMWFTSYEGLNRFDGHEFKVYSESPRDSNSLTGSQTFGLVEDAYGNIWTGTDVCLNRYLRPADQFDFVFAQNKEGDFVPAVTYPFFADSSEVWYINREEGIIVYDFIRHKKRLISADFLYRNSSYIINSTLRTRDGMIWHRDEIGLVCIDPYSGDYKWYFSDQEDNVLGETLKLTCFYQDNDDVIWLGYNNGIVRYDHKSKDYKKINLENHISTPIVDIKKDKDGFYWLGTEQEGLLYFSESLGIVDHFRAEGMTNTRLTGNTISTVYIDDQDLVWINTDPEGIDVIVKDLKQFKKYASGFFDPTMFTTEGVRTFLETTDGNIWVGTQGDGLFVFDPRTDRIIEHITPGKNGFVPTSATSLLQDSRGQIWVGTYDGLYLLEKEGDRFQKVVNKGRPSSMVSSNFISHMVETLDSTIIFGSEEGIYFIPPMQPEPIGIDTLRHIISGRLHLTGNGYLLVSENHKGFYVIKISDWIINQNLKRERFIKHYLPEFNIKHVYLSEDDNTLWIATSTGLLKAKYNKDWTDLELKKHYTRDDGLPSNSLYGLLCDKKGKLWVSSNRGISSFDPEAEIFSNYSIEDGLQGFEFNSNSFLKKLDGEFYFGGTNGFNRFYPEFKKNNIPPRIQITDFKVNDKIFEKENYIGEQEEIFLTFEENTFSIQFSAIDYQSNGNNKYKVILENYDNSWTDLDRTNNIRYTKVPPGDYIFKITAANNDEVWTREARSLQIHISTPWYQAWWAYLIYFGSFFFILFQFYQVRTRRQILKQQLLFEQKEADRLKELDTFKTRFYSNITHEFRTPLTVIQGLANELEDHPTKEPKQKLSLIKKNSHRLLSLVNQMLELSKLKAGKGKLDLEQDDIILFVKYLVEAHESFAKIKNVDLQFYSEEQEVYMDFDAKKIQQILINLISNAVKFTPEFGKILVVAQKENNTLKIKVEDNGIGIFPEQLPYIFDRFHQANPVYEEQGSGIGLALVKELIEVMNGKIKVESELNHGTTFFLTFPIQNKAPIVSSKTQVQIDQPKQIFINKNDQQGSIDKNDLPILLIIEDNVDVLFYLKTCLEDEYQILTARNGKLGIEKAIEVLPDIIISDVMMPEMDGFEVCAILKEDERTSHIPIILLTAKATQADKMEGLFHGADAYLIKPFEKEELFLRLNNLLKIRKTLHEKYGSGLVSPRLETQKELTKEDIFIKKIETIVLENMEDENFSSQELAQQLFLSRSQTHRKIKSLTSMSTAIYIRHIRLEKSKELLTDNQLSIAEVAYQVGFKSPVYFSQIFKETYGQSPSDSRK